MLPPEENRSPPRHNQPTPRRTWPSRKKGRRGVALFYCRARGGGSPYIAPGSKASLGETYHAALYYFA